MSRMAWVTNEQRLQLALGPLDLVHQLVSQTDVAWIRGCEISGIRSDIRERLPVGDGARMGSAVAVLTTRRHPFMEWPAKTAVGA